MAQHDVDSLLVTSAPNRSYLSGWVTGDDGQPSGALLFAHDVATLYTGATNLPWAAARANGVTVEPWQRPWTTTLAAAILATGAARLGIEEDALSVGAYWALRDGMPGLETIPVSGPLSALRRRKDEAELDLLSRAIAMTDEALASVLPGIVPGMTERTVATAIGRALTDAGGDGAAFPVIVASGPHAARPHHDPTDRPIAAGEPVIIDMGAMLGGYHGDLTRTVWIGDPDERLRTIYPIVLAAHDAAWAAARAGVAGTAVHEAAAEVIAAAGYGEYYPHGTGHGIGLQIHEAPSCGSQSTDILDIGDVITIEPGIYLPGWGGVRIEDAGVVGPDGLRRLTGAPKASV